MDVFCFRLLRKKNARAAIIAATARTPMTIPAIAPPDMLEDFEVEEEEEPRVADGVAEEFEEEMVVLELVPVDVAVDVVGEA